MLYADMFRFGYVKRIYRAAHGKETEQWTKFFEELFNTQEAFINKEETTVRFVRQQWDRKMATVKI